MGNKRITYGDITELFESEGFQRRPISESHQIFDRPDGAALVLPIRRSSIPAAGLHIDLTRRTLIDFGILTSEQFDRWLADPKHFQAA